jgi:hypothetical protein
MKTLILLIAGLLMYIPCQAAENMNAQEGQNVQPQQKDANEVDKYIARLRIEVEKDYGFRLVELNRQAQSELELLNIATSNLGCPVSLAAQAEVAKEVLYIDKFGSSDENRIFFEAQGRRHNLDTLESGTDFMDRLTISPRLFAERQSQIVERKNEILYRLEVQTFMLEQDKKYALTARLPHLEKQLRDNSTKPQPAAPQGVVTGIIYSDKPAAIIDGKIVHDGNSVNGATVKIYKDKVEFEKNGKKWQQEVGQKP